MIYAGKKIGTSFFTGGDACQKPEKDVIALSHHGIPSPSQSNPAPNLTLDDVFPDEPPLDCDNLPVKCSNIAILELQQDSSEMIRARLRLKDALQNGDAEEILKAHDDYEAILDQFSGNLQFFKTEFDEQGPDFPIADYEVIKRSFDLENSRYGGELTYFYDDLTDTYEEWEKTEPESVEDEIDDPEIETDFTDEFENDTGPE